MRFNRLRTLSTLTALALAAAGLTASHASAGPLVADAEGCGDPVSSQIFLPWLDPANYFLAPGGDFESAGEGWALEGGAAPVAGNSSHAVGGAEDSHSLALPSGSKATSPTVCVGLAEPTVRFFARNSGSPLSTLRVRVLFEDAAGTVRRATVGVVSAGPAWQPTAQIPVVVNLLPLLPGEQTPVAFELEPSAGGSWRIDDFYVDPMRRS